MPDKNRAFLMLDEDGVIVDCDGAIEPMFGYAPADLISRHVSMLLPKLQYIELMQNGQLNARLHYLCHIGLPFQVRRRDRRQYMGHLSLSDLSNRNLRRVRMCVWHSSFNNRPSPFRLPPP